MAIKKTPLLRFLFLLILIIAVFFRLYKLDSIPPGLYPDEAINGNEALESLKNKDFKLLYPENNGREGVFLWLLALSFALFDVSIWSLKIIPALFGILTVIGLYFLTKELFSLNTKYKPQAANIALLSSFFLSVSFWHVNFSRISFRAVLLPFTMVFSFFFLLRGFRKILFQEKGGRKVCDFIVAGIFYGLGFYTYTSFRVSAALLFLVLFLFLLLFKSKKLEKDFFQFTFYFILAVIITALPLGIHFIKNPQYFISRASQVFIFSQPEPLKAFLESLVLHLAMFNFHGDGNLRHNLPSSPQLLWPVGIPFLIGFFISIKELISSIKNKDWSLAVYPLFLLGWFFIMLSPGILTHEGLPHALRTIGVIPVAYIFAGLAIWQIYLFLDENTKNKKFLRLTSVVFLLLILTLQSNKYFIKWGLNPETKSAFSQDYVEMGNYLNSLPPKVRKIVIVNRGGVPVPWPDGIPMPSQTIMFMENIKYKEIQSSYLLPEEINTIKINKEPTIILPMAYEEKIFQQLEKMFPQGKVKKENEILIYQVNLDSI